MARFVACAIFLLLLFAFDCVKNGPSVVQRGVCVCVCVQSVYEN